MAQYDSFEPYYPHTILQLSHALAATQTFVRGNLVYIDSSGYLAECAYTAATAPTLVYGVAAEDATNTTATAAHLIKVGVYVITPEAVFSARSDATTAQADLGITCEVKLASSVWYVDKGAVTSNKAVGIIGFDPRDVVTTSGGRYLVKFCSNHIQGSYTT